MAPKLTQVAKSVGQMLTAPLRIRRSPDVPPSDPAHYGIPELAPSVDAAATLAADVPLASTPLGRWKEWPPLILSECDEPLAPGAPDIRGVWLVYKGPLKGHIERVEQAGRRVIVIAAGVVHDLTADGTMMHDEGVGGADIRVEARFEDGRHNLYLGGKRLVVTRYRDGDDMVWRWGPWKNRLRRLTGPTDAG